MTGDAPSVFGGRAGIHDRDVARPMLDMAKRAATRAAPTIDPADDPADDPAGDPAVTPA